MTRHSFATGVHIYIDSSRYLMVTPFLKDGVEHWELKNTKDNVREDRARAELDRLYDEGALRFDADQDEVSTEKRWERNRTHWIRLSIAPPTEQQILAVLRAVIRPKEKHPAPRFKTTEVFVDSAAAKDTVLQSVLAKLGRKLRPQAPRREHTIDQSTCYRWCEMYRAYEVKRDPAGSCDNSGSRNQLPPFRKVAEEVMARRLRRRDLGTSLQETHPVRTSIMKNVLKRPAARRLTYPGETLRMPAKSTFYTHWNQFDACIADMS